MDGSCVSFKVSGALDPVVKAAAHHTVLDMELTDATLEEVFLTFYAHFVIRAVASATVGAEEQGHLDTILALPISRTILVIGSYLVAAVVCAAIMAVTGAMTFIVGRFAGTDISLRLVTSGVLGVWPLAMFFGGVAALASGALHNSRTVNGIALGALVAMYAIDVAGRLAHSLEPLRWTSAFRYYGAPMRDGIDPASFIALVAAGVVLAMAGALLFERRDLLH